MLPGALTRLFDPKPSYVNICNQVPMRVGYLGPGVPQPFFMTVNGSLDMDLVTTAGTEAMNFDVNMLVLKGPQRRFVIFGKYALDPTALTCTPSLPPTSSADQHFPLYFKSNPVDIVNGSLHELNLQLPSVNAEFTVSTSAAPAVQAPYVYAKFSGTWYSAGSTATCGSPGYDTVVFEELDSGLGLKLGKYVSGITSSSDPAYFGPLHPGTMYRVTMNCQTGGASSDFANACFRSPETTVGSAVPTVFVPCP
ncbi:MAG: hypothetical protein AB7P04_12000 [Bacteriovoracia bacterium]